MMANQVSNELYSSRTNSGSSLFISLSFVSYSFFSFSLSTILPHDVIIRIRANRGVSVVVGPKRTRRHARDVPRASPLLYPWAWLATGLESRRRGREGEEKGYSLPFGLARPAKFIIAGTQVVVLAGISRALLCLFDWVYFTGVCGKRILYILFQASRKMIMDFLVVTYAKWYKEISSLLF